ncbi:MAG: hypothetical protein MR469_03510 [Campylobacter sp.]|nr:hypothetical protein [Campylobacter sp.]
MGEKIALHSAFVRGDFVGWFCGALCDFVVRFCGVVLWCFVPFCGAVLWGGFCGALCDFCGRHGKVNTQNKTL